MVIHLYCLQYMKHDHISGRVLLFKAIHIFAIQNWNLIVVSKRKSLEMNKVFMTNLAERLGIVHFQYFFVYEVFFIRKYENRFNSDMILYFYIWVRIIVSNLVFFCFILSRKSNKINHPLSLSLWKQILSVNIIPMTNFIYKIKFLMNVQLIFIDSIL
jgi:hypothetical protein